MELPRFSRKRTRRDRKAKRYLASVKTLLDGHQTDRVTPLAREAHVNGDAKSLREQMSSWSDTQDSVTRVLEHIKLRQASGDIFLSESVNKKFLEFHRDISEEYGAEDKQLSWAVIEKEEEIVMYGPYYPNYSNGEHSEDIIIQQTQELLDSGLVAGDWKVYVFTTNSPCLTRNTVPCMLNLVQQAQKWWSDYGVKTHVGYVRCWGFKGTKENLFRDVSKGQVDCIDQNESHESYTKTAEQRHNLTVLSESLYSVVKNLLRSENLTFPLMTPAQGQDWRSYFKIMSCIFECKPEDERKVPTQEVNVMIAAAQLLLSRKGEHFRESLEKGRLFALQHTFSSEVSDVCQDQIRLTFQQCWSEMVQDKYTEFIREKLTEYFNQSTVQLFIKDIEKFTREYLQIGRIQFSEGDSKHV